jgi:CheY-like chemotaxis protein
MPLVRAPGDCTQDVEDQSNRIINTMKQAVEELTPLKEKNALVVDSALATRRTLQDQLSQLGAKSVVFAGSVAEVEQQLTTRDFSLIVCEYQLEGERNGQQLLEELRLSKKLNWATAFMMVTGERVYNTVASVAEFAPDDYLIKPFTSSTLSQRIVKIFNRKIKLSKVYRAIFEGQFEEAPALCEQLIKEHPAYSSELERLWVESYYWAGDYNKTEEKLLERMAQAPKPWMYLLQAKVKLGNKQFEQANELLHTVVENNPEYMAAIDLYADVLWEQNRPTQALEVLEKMGARALNSTTRLRKLADLAVRVGDPSKSKTYLSKVIERSRNTSLSQMHDYLQLSKIYIQEGRADEAEKLTAKLRTTVSSSDLDLARTMMSVQKELSEKHPEKAEVRLNAFYEEYADIVPTLEPETLTSLLEMSFAAGMESKAYELASHISRKKPSKALLDRIRVAINEFKKQATPTT